MRETGTAARGTALFAGMILRAEVVAKDSAGSDGCRTRHLQRIMVLMVLLVECRVGGIG